MSVESSSKSTKTSSGPKRRQLARASKGARSIFSPLNSKIPASRAIFDSDRANTDLNHSTIAMWNRVSLGQGQCASPSFESVRFSTIPASLSPSPAIGQHFQHPGGSAANSLVRRCATRLELLEEFGIEDPKGQTAVVPELPSV